MTAIDAGTLQRAVNACRSAWACDTPPYDWHAIARAALEAAGVPALLDVAEAAHAEACVMCKDVCGASLHRNGDVVVADRIPEQCPKGRLRLALDRLDGLLPQQYPTTESEQQ